MNLKSGLTAEASVSETHTWQPNLDRVSPAEHCSGQKPRYRYDFSSKRLIPIRRLPYGHAAGCLDDHGVPGGHVVTVWPRFRYHALFTGDGNPHAFIHVRGIPLWSQETYVYLKERKEIVWAQIALLEKTFASPRHAGHKEIDTTPFPEDFIEVIPRTATCKGCGLKQPWRGKVTLICRICKKINKNPHVEGGQ